MQRIVIHGVSPHVTTGYGGQCGYLADALTELGYGVFVTSYAGAYQNDEDYHGIPVLSAQGKSRGYGADVLPGLVDRIKPDLVIHFGDSFMFDPEVVLSLRSKTRYVHWMAVDCSPVSEKDAGAVQHSGASVFATSQFGRQQLHAAGISSWYLPHAIDMDVFTCELTAREADYSREMTRAQLGISDSAFMVMCNGTNVDHYRKGWTEQLAAFKVFHRNHPDSVFYAHTAPHRRKDGALDLDDIAARLDIADAVIFPDQTRYLRGEISQHDLAALYRAADIYSCGSYAEGFCLPLAEAQACGTPAVATDYSAMGEVAAPECYRVPSEPYWVDFHNAWWSRPSMTAIYQAYLTAWAERHFDPATFQDRQLKARSHIQDHYSGDYVTENWLKPAMAEALSLPVISAPDFQKEQGVWDTWDAEAINAQRGGDHGG